MLSAFKRLTRSSATDVSGIGGSGGGGYVNCSGLQAMPIALQKKFSKGIQYNMKIIIKGDRNSGKTCLFRRLQGLPFLEEYDPTNEIQVANIQWNYKATDDIVKVEIWDVVDKAKRKKAVSQSLKLENESASLDSQNLDEIALDASFLDVYKNTQGVIFIFDMTKNWTFEYVKREILLVPVHLPILILGNHRDMGHHRVITKEMVLYFIESAERNTGGGGIRYCESSMRNGFGLKFIHKFFNLPFLHLQRETLLKQLDTNAEENTVTQQELNLYSESDETDYDSFIDGLTQRRRRVADSLSSPIPKVSVEEAKAIVAAKEKEMKETGNSVITAATNYVVEKGKDLSSRASEFVSSSEPALPISITPTTPKNVTKGEIRKLDPVDDFVPDDIGIEGSFFNDIFKGNPISTPTLRPNEILQSSDDEKDVNPLVASYTEDIDPDDFLSNSPPQRKIEPVSEDSEGEPLSGVQTNVSLPPTIPLEDRKKIKKKSKHVHHTHHRHYSGGSKKSQIDLDEFLNGSPSPNSPHIGDGGDYEPI